MIRSLVLQPLDDTRNETGPIRLSGFPCTIGRNHDCRPRLNLDRISRHHLKLTLDGERVLIEDLGSTNGTFVNDERISGATELRPGDRLHIADYAFRVETLAEADRQTSLRAGRPDTLAGQTIAGFTEDPTGFPVQAPQLYELLNDCLLEPMAVEVRVEGGPSDALLVFGRSMHATLTAGHDRLIQMSRELGEEARYHSVLRELALETAARAGLDSRLIILPVDAFEVEDAAVVLGELGALKRRFPRLHVACCVIPSELDAITLEQLSKSLEQTGIQLTARVASDDDEHNCRAAGVAALEIASDSAARPLEDYV
ncbi:MAG TPA: FHA domain-containing protein [Wenzhouxiangella sp.]|nr:FHA domain-containing protein [Wenzhouxiangella sp.]